MKEYEDFLKEKIKMAHMNGVPCDADEISQVLFPHQRDIVQWCVKGGQRAIFAAFGLGKTLIQAEIMRLLNKKTGCKTLIVCPLGVRQEFMRDGRMIGVNFEFIRRTEEFEASDGAFFLTNYESVRDGKLDPTLFNAVSLDEASVLRSYGSKTYQEFLPLFDGVQYKFVATATPAPNRYKELIHYAAFLGVADSGQLLTRFFQRDSTQANNLTLYPHSEKEFWAFMHSWAIFLQKPSELGYSDEGYTLPDAEIKFHEVERTDEIAIEKDGQILMFPEASAGLKEAAKEKRISLDTRVQKMKDLVEGYISQIPGGVMSPTGEIKDQIIIWCDLNDEQTAAEQVIKSLGLNCSSIYGSLTTEECEKRLEEWRNKETYALIGKPVMLGSGVNLQQCNKAIFLGISYKFNDTIQAVHRIQRFQQTRTCEIHFIYCESEREVLQTLNRKWAEHNKLMANMSEIIKEHGLHNLGIVALLRNMGVKRRVEKGHMYEVALNDCVDEARLKEDSSVDLIISSIPFSNHYEYSPNYADMGHTESNDHFWSQMDYLTPELLRILSPGRIAAIHVKDRILFGNVTGAGIPTNSPFHAEAIFHYIKHGFDYMGMITVVTDVVRENNQTYRLGWTENSKDGTKMGVGSPEYVLLFHKPQTDRTRGYADVPVQKDKREYTRAQWQIDAHAFWRSSGNRFLTAEELKGYGPEDIGKAFKEASLNHIYDYKAHVEVGEELDRKGKLPSTFMAIAPGSHDPMVWDDVNRMLTLNGEQSRRGLQAHLCPLQWDIVDRLITRYSNKGELVYDPFGGLMTVPFRAIKLGRRGGASELCEGYFNDGIRYLALADSEMSIPSLFEMEELKAE